MHLEEKWRGNHDAPPWSEHLVYVLGGAVWSQNVFKNLFRND
jgi:hypothetical protein